MSSLTCSIREIDPVLCSNLFDAAYAKASMMPDGYAAAWYAKNPELNRISAESALPDKDEAFRKVALRERNELFGRIIGVPVTGICLGLDVLFRLGTRPKPIHNGLGSISVVGFGSGDLSFLMRMREFNNGMSRTTTLFAHNGDVKSIEIATPKERPATNGDLRTLYEIISIDESK